MKKVRDCARREYKEKNDILQAQNRTFTISSEVLQTRQIPHCSYLDLNMHPGSCGVAWRGALNFVCHRQDMGVKPSSVNYQQCDLIYLISLSLSFFISKLRIIINIP